MAMTGPPDMVAAMIAAMAVIVLVSIDINVSA